MIRKLFSIVPAILVVLLLSACQNDTVAPEQTTTTETSVATTATESPAATTTAPSSNTTPSATTTVKTISREQAKIIALQHAGLTNVTVRRAEAERDVERGVLVYEVEFDHNGYEYSYDIHAETGEILWHEKELDD